MKLLLDECTPKRLKREFINHQFWTVDDAGFKGLENGELLQAASNYDVLITVDRKADSGARLLQAQYRGLASGCQIQSL